MERSPRAFGRSEPRSAAGVALGLTFVTAFPGFALLVGGPLIVALNTTVAGTLGGALNGLGWWRTEPELPADVLERGGVLVGVGVPTARTEDAVRALEAAGASQVDVT
jgi:hypothetical protein